MSCRITQAVVASALAENDIVLSVLTLIQLHGLLQPGQVDALHLDDLVFDSHDKGRYVQLFGLVAVRLPRTCRHIQHAGHQHVLIEFPGTAALLQSAQAQECDCNTNFCNINPESVACLDARTIAISTFTAPGLSSAHMLLEHLQGPPRPEPLAHVPA